MSPRNAVGGKALIIVDVQNDFLPGGSLAVPHGDEVVGPLVELATNGDFDLVVASQDWHPQDHCSFVAKGGSWPEHCVMEQRGAALHPSITKVCQLLVQKGQDKNTEQYSAFDGAGLAEKLRAVGVDTVFIGGLATDYCVKATAEAALAEGFRTLVMVDAIRAVNVRANDGESALASMVQKGAKLVTTVGVLQRQSADRVQEI